jgi:hypothetical protein
MHPLAHDLLGAGQLGGNLGVLAFVHGTRRRRYATTGFTWRR